MGQFFKTFKTAIKTRIQSSLKAQDGLTLVDVAVLLMLIGILAAPLLQEHHIYRKNSDKNDTLGGMFTADEALQAFYYDNDRFPCPADPTLVQGAANYGIEDIDAATGLCNSSDPASPTPNPNIIAAPARDVDNADLDGDITTGVDNVLIGMLPFETLKIPFDAALDAYQNRYTYAITDVMADAARFAPDRGAVTVVENETIVNSIAPDGISPVFSCGGPPTTTNNLYYALLSHGPDGLGAFNNSGNRVQACPPVANGLDSENCDNDAQFLFPTCVRNDIAGANFYDDLFLLSNLSKNIIPEKIWDNGTNPQDLGSNVGYLGLGHDDPQEAVDVMGNVRADLEATDANKQGLARAFDYCDTNGNNCFTAELIAGDVPKMKCDNNTGMVGIKHSSANCTTPITAATSQSCPSGEYIIEITSAGDITCGKP